MTVGTININGETYAHHHSEITVTPNAGSRKGQQFTLRSLTSLDYGRKRKSTHAGGTQIDPVAIARGMNKPEWSGEMSELEWRAFCGWDQRWGAHSFTISVTKQIEGDVPHFDDILDATFDDDDHSSKEGSAQTRKIGGLARKILNDGIDPTEDPTKPGASIL
jgi:hypothetical protein